jgi:hypothetical protein
VPIISNHKKVKCVIKAEVRWWRWGVNFHIVKISVRSSKGIGGVEGQKRRIIGAYPAFIKSKAVNVQSSHPTLRHISYPVEELSKEAAWHEQKPNWTSGGVRHRSSRHRQRARRLRGPSCLRRQWRLHDGVPRPSGRLRSPGSRGSWVSPLDEV